MAPTRILAVDDFPPFRLLARSTLASHPRLRIIGEAADGQEAVEKARYLRPELILLDIGLPTLNGIEAARRIREFDPETKIVFLSQNCLWSIVEEGLRAGADGYVLKTDISTELSTAVEAVLEGRQYVSSSFNGHIDAAPAVA